MFRIDKLVFIMLLNDLIDIFNLKGSRNITPPEFLGMFLYMLRQGDGNRNAQERFQ